MERKEREKESAPMLPGQPEEGGEREGSRHLPLRPVSSSGQRAELAQVNRWLRSGAIDVEEAARWTLGKKF